MTSSTHVNGTTSRLWPAQYLKHPNPDPNSNGVRDTRTAALVVLNSPIGDYRYFSRLKSHSAFTICADGGANQLFDLMASQGQAFPLTAALAKAKPDLIHGDLDSLWPHVRDAYESIGVEISRDPDQYSTDLGKALKVIMARVEEVKDILVLGSIGGRVDQGIGILHELYREQVVRHPTIRFWLFSESSITTVLLAGTTVIHTPLGEGLIKRNVGILPLYGQATISTKGLEWDVQDWETRMGEMVSTNNHIMEDEISITCDKAVLFTVQRAPSAMKIARVTMRLSALRSMGYASAAFAVALLRNCYRMVWKKWPTDQE
nr:thiamine pyrophosphokinase 1 [Quercus suber]